MAKLKSDKILILTISVQNISSLRSILRKLSLKWSTLSTIGKNSYVKSFSIWFALIPVVAKFFSEIRDVVALDLFGYTWQLNLTLPFSWTMFYSCSVLFTIANIIYYLCCPKIIKEYDSYIDFKSKEDSKFALEEMLFSSWHRSLGRNQSIQEDDFLEGASVHYDGLYKTALKYISQGNNAEGFAIIRAKSDNQLPIVRQSCSLFYICGFIFLIIVFFQNFIFVSNIAFYNLFHTN